MTDCGCPADQADTLERRTLRALLVVNGVMFVAEAGLGWWAESTALLADSLDMLADAAVYGLSLRAVGGSGRRRSRAATFSGVLQMALGAGVLLEVGRRFLSGSDPVSTLMMAVGAAALAANLGCLALLAKHRGGGVHMRASWIFSTNDVIANVGVILSGALVLWTGSRWPDLIVGAVVAVVVLWGGVRILREARTEKRRLSDQEKRGDEQSRSIESSSKNQRLGT